MNKQYLFIANWKMNMSFREEITFATNNYDRLISLENKAKQKIILCPSFVSLYTLSQIFKETQILIGAQTCSEHTHGAFTGQISPKSLNSSGCTHCIIGHSENRKHTNQTNEKTAQACVHLLDYDITPIICIGENKKQNQQKKTLDVLKQQLDPIFEHICSKTNVSSYLSPCIAYEPIWSIGTGETPSQEALSSVYAWLENYAKQVCPTITWTFLYGGSVTSKTITSIKKIRQIKGFLLGKASLDFQELEKIVQLVAEV